MNKNIQTTDQRGKGSPPRYHINSKGEPGVCKATKRACQFGESDHFSTRTEAEAEAQKRLERKFSTIRKGFKKDLPEKVVSTADWNSLTPSERADLAIFEAMKRLGIRIGKPDHNYYGQGVSMDNDLKMKLEAFIEKPLTGVGLYDFEIHAGKMNSDYELNFVPGSLRQHNLSEFNGTFDESSQVLIMTADAVLKDKKGNQVKIPIAVKADFIDIINEVVDGPEDIDWKTGRIIENDERIQRVNSWD